MKPLSLARLGMAELVSSKPCSERDIVLAMRTRRNARKGPGFRRADSPCGTGAGSCRRSPRSAAPRSKRAESRSRWTRSRPRIWRRCFGCCRRNLQYGAVFPETGTRIGRAEMRPHRSNKGPPASGEVRLSAGTSVYHILAELARRTEATGGDGLGKDSGGPALRCRVSCRRSECGT